MPTTFRRRSGGVSSPVRAFGSVQGDPPFVARGEGAFVFDAPGKRYVDLMCSWGPLILGHAHGDRDPDAEPQRDPFGDADAGAELTKSGAFPTTLQDAGLDKKAEGL